jgi:FHA domain
MAMSEQTNTMQRGDQVAAPARSQAALLYLAGALGSQRGHLLIGRNHVLGREPGPGGIVLLQSSVSRQHASLRAEGEGFGLRDLGSRNGTWLNGQRIEQAPLTEGDVVRIGDALFVFVASEGEEHLSFPSMEATEPAQMVGGCCAIGRNHDDLG